MRGRGKDLGIVVEKNSLYFLSIEKMIIKNKQTKRKITMKEKEN